MGWERQFNKMIKISDKEFEAIVADSFKAVSSVHLDNLSNIAIVIEDEPTIEQRRNLNLKNHQTLFGLFEGVPKTKKSSMSPYELPDKITIFKLPLVWASTDINDLKNNVANTLWHEIGHYFGLNHVQIHELEQGKSKD